MVGTEEISDWKSLEWKQENAAFEIKKLQRLPKHWQNLKGDWDLYWSMVDKDQRGIDPPKGSQSTGNLSRYLFTLSMFIALWLHGWIKWHIDEKTLTNWRCLGCCKHDHMLLLRRPVWCLKSAFALAPSLLSLLSGGHLQDLQLRLIQFYVYRDGTTPPPIVVQLFKSTS